MRILDIAGFALSIGADRDETPLVSELDLSVDAGECLCVVGESGSGKTVTALSIVRLLEFTAPVTMAGRIALDGVDVLGLEERPMRALRSRDIGIVFQEGLDSLNPAKRIGPQLVEAFVMCRRHTGERRNAAVDRAAMGKARSLLTEVGLPDTERILRSYPHQLSGGMQQRVMIAMALMTDPKLLIADEPTTALDVTTQAEILELLRRLRESHGMACVFITHDLGVAAQIADRIAVMYRGSLVEVGDAADVLTRPRHPYTRALLECMPQVGVRRESGFPTISRDRLAAAVRNGGSIGEVTTTPQIPPRAGESIAPDAPVLTIDDVSKVFRVRDNRGRRDLIAVDGLSLEVRPGEFFGLVGESGSGKSTLGRMVTALETPTSGEIRFGPHRVGTRGILIDRREFRRAVQIVFQDPQSSLDPRMTVAASIAEPLRALTDGDRGAITARVRELLDEVGMPAGSATRYPSELSGGQRQRVAIARAIAVEPDLVVADEPTSALDASVQGQVMNVLLALQRRRGLSLLFITHNLSLVLAVADRVGVMQAGRLVELGTAAEISRDPRDDYTRRLMAANPRFSLCSGGADGRRGSPTGTPRVHTGPM